MKFKVEATPNFVRELKPLTKKFPSLKKEILLLEQQLEQNPTTGISLGNECYKIRLAIASKNKGKSGGARVITCFKRINEKVYLVSIYDKSEQGDISEKELDNILKNIV